MEELDYEKAYNCLVGLVRACMAKEILFWYSTLIDCVLDANLAGYEIAKAELLVYYVSGPELYIPIM